MARFTRRRRVFRTDNDYFGNGPLGIREGDEEWVLAGGRVPFVLRPLSCGRYSLVGDAYVHGAMRRGVIERLGTGELTSLELE